ncbi:MAG: CU044_2847 family protein [Aggregatilineales bacterium]
MPKRYVEFPLSGGGTVVVEVDEPGSRGSQEAGLRPGEIAERAGQTFKQALDRIKPTADAILSRLHSLIQKPDEIEVEFGLKLSAEAGMVIASGAVEANYTVRLKWTPKEAPKA